jgi:hypothetical protein
MTNTAKLEQRHYSRIPFHAEVTLSFSKPNETLKVHLLDISLKGALVELEQAEVKTYKGKSCEMTLSLGGRVEDITLEGSVAHQEGTFIGIHCHHIDLDSITSLRRLIELNSGDENLLEREFNEMLNQK